MPDRSVAFKRLGSGDVASFRSLIAVFEKAFEDRETYQAEPPTDSYLEALLEKDHVIATVGVSGDEVLGGLVAYELEKFERSRSEIYIYDLAVLAEYRRQRVATRLIEHLQDVAADRGAWVIFVQADYGDDVAIALYERFGAREEVLHFDIKPRTNSP